MIIVLLGASGSGKSTLENEIATKFGYKKILKRYSEYRPEQFVAIGDQIVTDIWGASRMKIKGILVKPIRLDNEKWYTRFNRRIEKFIIKHKIKKYNIELYKTILDVKGE